MWAISDDEASVANPCVWPIIGDCDLNRDIDDEVVSVINQFAIEILHAASGRQFGQCTVTYRPCREGCAPSLVDSDMWSLIDIRNAGQPSSFEFAVGESGYAASLVCARCLTDDCSCVALEAIRLWHKRVSEIVEVQIDGAILAETDYRLWRNQLLRLGGDAWPDCQDFTLDNGEVDTWSITYKHGLPVPAGGQFAAGLLQCELAKAACGDTTCQLPKRVQSITRQGVSVAFLDPMQFLAEGKTSLYAVDLWLEHVNPNRLQRRARVFRADSVRRGRSRVPNWDVFGGS
jgi:hypothetical protein